MQILQTIPHHRQLGDSYRSKLKIRYVLFLRQHSLQIEYAHRRT